MSDLLRRLDVLVGVWEFRALLGGQPTGVGRMTFDWLEGGAFLVQRSDMDPVEMAKAPPEWTANLPFPTSSIIGLDDSTEQFTMLYSDARQVYRVYRMTLADGVWTIWRDVPGFNQRFTGTFSEDGKTVTARWDFSSDGSSWATDFDLIYTRV